MPEVQPPNAISYGCVTALLTRQLNSTVVCVPGVVLATAAGHFVATGSPTLRQVTLTAGQAWIRGTESATQGQYFVTSDGPVSLTLDAADPVDPRLDRIVARVRDADYSGVLNKWALEVVKGTPSPAPVLPALPANSISICQVLVPAGATATPTANITDLRTQYALCSPNTSGQNPTRSVLLTASGNFTKAQYPGLVAVTAHVWGAGGGSGGCAATAAGQEAFSGGGGGGAYARRRLPVGSLAATEAIVVGAGGAAGAAGNNNGGNGGQSIAFLAVAGGGNGGQGGSAGTATRAQGGVGGAVSGTYDLGIAGADAGWSCVVAAQAQIGTTGGAAANGGTPSRPIPASGIATAPSEPGAGATGSWRSASLAAVAGRAGANGWVFLELHYV